MCTLQVEINIIQNIEFSLSTIYSSLCGGKGQQKGGLPWLRQEHTTCVPTVLPWQNVYGKPSYLHDLFLIKWDGSPHSPSESAAPCRICVFGMFMSLVCPMRVPAVFRGAQKKHAPGNLEHVPCVFGRVWLLSAWWAQSACLRRFAELSKNTALDTWSMYLACLICLDVMLPSCCRYFIAICRYVAAIRRYIVATSLLFCCHLFVSAFVIVLVFCFVSVFASFFLCHFCFCFTCCLVILFLL